jgi:hypothetical protein
MNAKYYLPLVYSLNERAYIRYKNFLVLRERGCCKQAFVSLDTFLDDVLFRYTVFMHLCMSTFIEPQVFLLQGTKVPLFPYLKADTFRYIQNNCIGIFKLYYISFLFCCHEHHKCHGMSRQMKGFHVVKLHSSRV